MDSIGVCYYRIIQESGIKTDFPIYVVGVFSGDKMIAEGTVTFKIMFTWFWGHSELYLKKWSTTKSSSGLAGLFKARLS